MGPRGYTIVVFGSAVVLLCVATLLTCLINWGFSVFESEDTDLRQHAWRTAFVEPCSPETVNIVTSQMWRGNGFILQCESLIKFNMTDEVFREFETRRGLALIQIDPQGKDVLPYIGVDRPSWFPKSPYKGFNAWKITRWPLTESNQGNAWLIKNRMGIVLRAEDSDRCYAYVLKDDLTQLSSNFVWQTRTQRSGKKVDE